MSAPSGEFINGNGESGQSSDVDGVINAESGDNGTQGNVDRPTNIIDGFESWSPASPSTERIRNAESDTGNGESVKRTKSGKIDRRTRAGRNAQTQAPDSVAPARGGKLISLEKAILSLHDMAAGIFGIPEIALSEQEAGALNDAVLDVSKYYVSAFDPKKVAIFNLVTCMGGIYAVRVMAYRNRVAHERRGKISVLPKQDAPAAPQPQQGVTIEQYLGGMPPAEGAAGF